MRTLKIADSHQRKEKNGVTEHGTFQYYFKNRINYLPLHDRSGFNKRFYRFYQFRNIFKRNGSLHNGICCRVCYSCHTGT